MRIGVLASGSGTNLQALLDADLGPAEIALVICNVPGARAIERAEQAHVPATLISHRDYPSREAFDAALVEALRAAGVELVVLAGFMRVLTPAFVDAFADRVINIHPSLLPAFPGVDAQRQAFEAGVRITGCTVHLVDRGIDTGPILAQAAVAVGVDDQLVDVQRRILAQEHRLLPAVVRAIAHGHLTFSGSRPHLARWAADPDAVLVSPQLPERDQ